MANSFFEFVDNPSDILVVAFSHVGYPIGKFAFSNAISNLECKKLYLNCVGNSWYQTGVPGLGDSIDEVADHLKVIIRNLNPSRVVFLGMSMGGYAALVFGILCGASLILAFTAELVLGMNHLRSFKENSIKQYDQKYVDISDLINSNTKSTIFLIYGELDLVDLSGLFNIRHAILERKKVQFFLCKGGHQCTLQLNLPLILNELLKNGWLSAGLIDPNLVLDYVLSEREFAIYRSLQDFLNLGLPNEVRALLSTEPLLIDRPLFSDLFNSIGM